MDASQWHREPCGMCCSPDIFLGSWGQFRYASLGPPCPVLDCSMPICFLRFWLIRCHAHLVLDGAGKGRLWDCSRALCWLASAVGQRTARHLAAGTEHLCTHRLKALGQLTMIHKKT